MALWSIFSLLWKFHKSAIILLTPLLFLPLPIIGKSQMSDCAYVICIMAIYWTTEACPLSVTSLLPVILFPLFGIQSADEVSMNYMKHICFLLIGTFAVCIAIEEWNLHRRFALKVLLFFGSKPCWMMLGLMLITAFLSMWLSNTSTSALMHPIAAAVCREINSADKKKRGKNKTDKDDPDTDSSDETKAKSNCILSETVRFVPDENNIEAKILEKKNVSNTEIADINMEKAMLLAVTYASTLGGMCTTVGTPPNLVAIGIFSTTFGDEAAADLNFVKWLAFCLPLSIICIFITWLWILLRFLSLRQLLPNKEASTDNEVKNIIRKNYEALPPMCFGEIAVVIHFLVLIVLWFLRDPRIFTGWGSLFPGSYAKDSTTSVLIAMSIFTFPSKYSSISWIWKGGKNGESKLKPSPALLSWKTFQKKCPWDVMLLLGAGFALAGACVKSGLSEWVGQKLTVLYGTPTWIIILVLSITISIITEFTSNVATTSIFLPIMIRLAIDVQINPVMVLIVATLSCSFAFSLPIATPPNALAFTYGSLRVMDMVTTGLPLNFICVGLLNVFIHLTGTRLFNLDTMPEWALNNATAITSTLSP